MKFSCSYLRGACYLVFLVTAALLGTSTTSAFEKKCGKHGECRKLKNQVEILLSSRTCRAVYTTGLCSANCWNNLQTMMSKGSTWESCDQDCRWPPDYTNAIISWIDFCDSRLTLEKLEDGVNDPETDAMDINSKQGLHSSAVDAILEELNLQDIQNKLNRKFHDMRFRRNDPDPDEGDDQSENDDSDEEENIDNNNNNKKSLWSESGGVRARANDEATTIDHPTPRGSEYYEKYRWLFYLIGLVSILLMAFFYGKIRGTMSGFRSRMNKSTPVLPVNHHEKL